MTKTPRRLGLDRDRKASHDLIRLLDKPVSEVRISIEIAFRSSPRRRAFDDGKPTFATDSRVTGDKPRVHSASGPRPHWEEAPYCTDSGNSRFQKREKRLINESLYFSIGSPVCLCWLCK
jgi:hypothetical protein